LSTEHDFSFPNAALSFQRQEKVSRSKGLEVKA